MFFKTRGKALWRFFLLGVLLASFHPSHLYAAQCMELASKPHEDKETSFKLRDWAAELWASELFYIRVEFYTPQSFEDLYGEAFYEEFYGIWITHTYYAMEQIQSLLGEYEAEETDLEERSWLEGSPYGGYEVNVSLPKEVWPVFQEHFAVFQSQLLDFHNEFLDGITRVVEGTLSGEKESIGHLPNRLWSLWGSWLEEKRVKKYDLARQELGPRSEVFSADVEWPHGFADFYYRISPSLYLSVSRSDRVEEYNKEWQDYHEEFLSEVGLLLDELGVEKGLKDYEYAHTTRLSWQIQREFSGSFLSVDVPHKILEDFVRRFNQECEVHWRAFNEYAFDRWDDLARDFAESRVGLDHLEPSHSFQQLEVHLMEHEVIQGPAVTSYKVLVPAELLDAHTMAFMNQGHTWARVNKVYLDSFEKFVVDLKKEGDDDLPFYNFSDLESSSVEKDLSYLVWQSNVDSLGQVGLAMILPREYVELFAENIEAHKESWKLFHTTIFSKVHSWQEREDEKEMAAQKTLLQAHHAEEEAYGASAWMAFHLPEQVALKRKRQFEVVKKLWLKFVVDLVQDLKSLDPQHRTP